MVKFPTQYTMLQRGKRVRARVFGAMPDVLAAVFKFTCRVVVATRGRGEGYG